jgi:hypothetical protein
MHGSVLRKRLLQELTYLSLTTWGLQGNEKKTGQYRQNGNVTFLEVFSAEGK